MSNIYIYHGLIFSSYITQPQFHYISVVKRPSKRNSTNKLDIFNHHSMSSHYNTMDADIV